MLVPLSWLKDFVQWDVSLDELCERLTLAGLEVASVEKVGEHWDRDKIFVAEVLSVRPHPNADRLTLVTVNYGHGEPLEVITGAPNIRVGDSGQKVVFATVGARLVDPYAETFRYKTLKRSKIRGVVSEGMLCSEKELGISDEHTGIIILPDDAPVGMPFADYWGDTVLDLDLTPNLARCFSIVGVAREVAALFNAPLQLPNPQVQAEGAPIDGQVEVIIQDPDLCPRYSAALIKGVKIAPSPQWMQRRLLLAGMRPINNIVDITNYVMLELGQPLHAFDYHRLHPQRPGSPPTIIVRRAHAGEMMTTLDGIERTFTEDMLLITDGGGPVAVAGVMGGEASEVTEETVDVLLEAANFDFISIRRTSAALKIPSESAQRFGRGVDPELTTVALHRAAELMRELAGGTVAQGFVDVYPRPPQKRIIDFPASEPKRLLGIELPAEKIANILTSLGFSCEIVPGEPAIIRTKVPSFRFDVSNKADLVEEIARIYGYDQLPITLMNEEIPFQQRNRDLELEERVRDILVGCGLTEVLSYSMTNLESVGKLSPKGTPPSPEGYIRLANPLSREYEFMRQTLMNTSLEIVARNLRFVDRVAIFEIGKVYLPREGRDLPDEPRRLSIALAGPREARSWLTNESPEIDFFDLKGIVEALCTHLGIDEAHFVPTEHPTFHPGRVAALYAGEENLGILGEVHPMVRSNFDLPEQQRVCLAELDLEKLLSLAQPERQFQEISRMPPVKLDLAIVVDEDAPADEIARTIREAGGKLLTHVVLFDVYRGEQIGPGKKSLAYSLTFQAANKTLTSEEAVKQRDRILRRLRRDFGAQLRG
ncbi:MAG: phenylalanine--tRNA ligase subunit beta [Anaerolineae bacterium]|nr:phenylalanine--tRNA ligase subunit beta [Anaerolineae bacterium]